MWESVGCVGSAWTSLCALADGNQHARPRGVKGVGGAEGVGRLNRCGSERMGSCALADGNQHAWDSHFQV